MFALRSDTMEKIIHLVIVLALSVGLFSSVSIVGSAAAQEQQQQDGSTTGQITGGNITKAN